MNLSIEDTTALEIADKLCNGNATLLYLTRYGSRLYGTFNDNSDYDYKGIVLIDSNKLLTGYDYREVYTYEDTTNKIEISLYSLQYFIKHLVAIGEATSIDLLYSHTNDDAVLYSDPCMDTIFKNKLKFFNITDTSRYIDYAVSQAIKYGLKGNTVNTLKNVLNYLRNVKDDSVKFNVTIIDDIIEKFSNISGEKNLSKTVADNGDVFINICKRMYQNTLTIKRVKQLLTDRLLMYGKRSELAGRNNSIDNKALSHTMRALTQILSLYKYGTICFPLYNSEFLKFIRNGHMDVHMLMCIINDTITEINTIKQMPASIDYEFINNTILNIQKRVIL
jgi:hypothetical protein